MDEKRQNSQRYEEEEQELEVKREENFRRKGVVNTTNCHK